MKGDEYYESILLTEEEIKDALLEAKKKKFFYERSKEYWESLGNVEVNIKPKYTKELKIKVGKIKIDKSLPMIKG